MYSEQHDSEIRSPGATRAPAWGHSLRDVALALWIILVCSFYYSQFRELLHIKLSWLLKMM